MQIQVSNGWLLFCVAIGVMLFALFLMTRLARHFVTMDVVLRRFSIVELQWPGSPLELVNLVKGLYKLPDTRRHKTLRALRLHLLTDFLLMPGAYGAIFLLCMNLSWKMQSFGVFAFILLAWLQLAAWLLDIIENMYLLFKISPDISAPSATTYRMMQWVQYFKWGIPLVGTITALSAVLYFWLTGNYQAGNLWWLLLLAAEIIVFFTARSIATFFIKKVDQLGE